MGVNNVGFSQITAIQGTAKTILDDASPPMPSTAKGARVNATANDLRWRDDGTAPTASVGQLIDISVNPNVVFDSWSVPRQNFKAVLKKIQFIQAVASTTGVINISWYD